MNELPKIDVLALAKALNGPHDLDDFASNGNYQVSLDTLREIRWGQINSQSQGLRLQLARAAIHHMHKLGLCQDVDRKTPIANEK